MFERMNLKIVNSSSDFKVMFLSYQTIFFCALKNNMRRVSYITIFKCSLGLGTLLLMFLVAYNSNSKQTAHPGVRWDLS